MNGLSISKTDVSRSLVIQIRSQKVLEMIAKDRRMTLRIMIDELGINKEMIRQSFHEDLGKRKIYAKFIPPNLTDCAHTSFTLEATMQSFLTVLSLVMSNECFTMILRRNGGT